MQDIDTMRQVRAVIDMLRNGVEPQVTFYFDLIKMASQAVEYCCNAMFKAIEILEVGRQKMKIMLLFVLVICLLVSFFVFGGFAVLKFVRYISKITQLESDFLLLIITLIFVSLAGLCMTAMVIEHGESRLKLIKATLELPRTK